MQSTRTGHVTDSPADWSWRLHAACRGVDTAVFYGPDGERERQAIRQPEPR